MTSFLSKSNWWGRVAWSLVLLCCWGRLGLAQPGPDDGDRVFVYKNAAGRLVYVDDLKRVPRQFKEQARPVDLSEVSLNPQLGQELAEQGEKAHQRVREAQKRLAAAGQADPCLDQPAPGIMGWVTWAWRHHGHLILIALAFLGLLLATPFINRRIDPAQWQRVLMVVLPLLVFLGLISYTVDQTSSAIRQVRDGENPACSPSSAAGRIRVRPSSPGLDTMHKARSVMKKVNQERSQELDQILSQ